MPSEEYAAIVYDLDGTLVDLDVDWAAARRAVVDVLRSRDVAFDDAADLWDLLAVAEERGHLPAVEAELGEHERVGARSAAVLPLAEDLPHDVPVGVCSLNCEAACRIALERHDLAAHVDAVVGRDSHSTRKPDPGPLLAVLEELDAAPERSLFVGDSASDQEAAAAAGVDFQWIHERRNED